MSASIPDFEHARLTCDDRGVYTLTIVEAGALNILGTPVLRGLTDALQWLAGRTDPRVLILRGSGERAFVAGADIHEMAALAPESARAFITRVRALCDAVRALPVPVIARVPGHCLGAGMELAAACDIRLAASAARVGMPEVRVGLPSVVHAALLPGLIGQGASDWLTLTGETVDAEQARAWGFFQFVAEAQELDALVEQSAAAIVAAGARAVGAQKRLNQHWADADLETALDHSVSVFGAAFETDEPARCMAPFLRRRSG
ncbi:enoyl-CoA hydratase [Salinisphaera orenii MK-B5]|uniref:Enoyl-CoA hydratase n=1 Tax=Salinisphaera orenii MK-B5 TaxID=856730 RepID=A0A423PFT5_9GAMM|nr:enoyl-CoA hydratase [Salinisphaera orenii]ROO24452.1 enoyl-CoA hydratase [Salinisphaera orenii MK-B5]